MIFVFQNFKRFSVSRASNSNDHDDNNDSDSTNIADIGKVAEISQIGLPASCRSEASWDTMSHNLNLPSLQVL